MSKQIILIENGVINSMVAAYQVQPTENAYMEIHEAVYPMAEQVAFGFYHKSKGLNVDADEFLQCARIAIFKAVEAFDASKGSNFTSLVKQLVQWTIQDEIIKKHKTVKAEFAKAALSLDMPNQPNHGTFLDVVEAQIATEHDYVINSVIEQADQDSASQSVEVIMATITKDFSESASADDASIIKAWVSLMLSENLDDSSAFTRLVNKELKGLFPNISSSALRKKKERAETRFNIFAQDLGYNSFKLSHF